ncbi:MAG: hypothetical protein ACE5PT_13225 [Gemmatimonadales bacterium]
METERPSVRLMRVMLSLLCASVLYAVWLAIFLPVMLAEVGILTTVGWVTAPVAAALGFAIGIVVFDRLTGFGASSFRTVFALALVACVVGTIIVWPIDSTLIVLGMLGAGTIAMLGREITQFVRTPQL